MGNREPLSDKEFYHIYNRGTEKRKIFESDKDYERFLVLLYLSNSSERIHINDYRGSTSGELLSLERGIPFVEIASYCLMPNHFHLLVRQTNKNGISKFMQKVSTGYTMYFNTKYERNGSLFQGRFKSVHAQNDRYLKYLLSYIHLNPTRADTHPYSSYSYFCKKDSIWNRLLDTRNLPVYFESPDQFKRELLEWRHFPEVEPRGDY